MAKQLKKRDFRVRPAEFNDVVEIFNVLKEHPREVLARSVGDIVQNIDRFFVAVAGNRVVGTAAWQILPEIGRVTEPSIEIKSVSVSRDFQRRGAGDALIKAVIRHVRAYHPAQLVVLTFSPDYFRRFGFVETPKEKLMHKLYSGCFNCTKYQSPFTCPEVAMTIALGWRRKKS